MPSDTMSEIVENLASAPQSALICASTKTEYIRVGSDVALRNVCGENQGQHDELERQLAMRQAAIRMWCGCVVSDGWVNGSRRSTTRATEHTHMQTYTLARAHAYMLTEVCTQMYIHSCTHTHTRMHTNIHMCRRTHTRYAHICTCTHARHNQRIRTHSHT